MNNFFQIIFRVMLLLAGMFFFFVMLVVGAISAMVLMLRLLWYRITGKDSAAGVNVKFWTMEKNAPKPSERPLEDVTDVEVKEFIRPEDMDDSAR
jgi:hypothetical protein